MAEVLEIENLLENNLNIHSDSESEQESEWDEIELGSSFDDDDEISELPAKPAATSSPSQRPKKPWRSLSTRAGLFFPCSRVLRHMKTRDSSKRVQRGKFNLFPRSHKH